MSQQQVRVEDVDALVSGATPQFSMQIKARLFALIRELDPDDDVRRYGEQQMALLDALAMGTTRGVRAPGRPPADAEGWEALPSHPRGGPLPS